MAEIIDIKARNPRPKGPPGGPVFNMDLPKPVLILLAIFAVIHIVRQVLPSDLDAQIVAMFGFVPQRFAGADQSIPGGIFTAVTSFLSYAFLHSDFAHLIFNSIWFLLFGSVIYKRSLTRNFLLFLATVTVAAALAYLLSNWNEQVLAIGASGAVSGLMGAMLRFIMNAFDRGGIPQLRDAPQTIPLMSIRRALSDTRVLVAGGLYIVLDLFAGLGLLGDTGIAWEAHLGGFIAGFLLYGWFDAASQQTSGFGAPPKRHQPTLH